MSLFEQLFDPHRELREQRMAEEAARKKREQELREQALRAKMEEMPVVKEAPKTLDEIEEEAERNFNILKQKMLDGEKSKKRGSPAAGLRNEISQSSLDDEFFHLDQPNMKLQLFQKTTLRRRLGAQNSQPSTIETRLEEVKKRRDEKEQADFKFRNLWLQRWELLKHVRSEAVDRKMQELEQ